MVALGTQMDHVWLYDTTLRDGTQAEGISLSVEDKIKITQLLDQLGIDYIEGGWPGSNPLAVDFFRRMQEVELKRARLTAFGSTRHFRVGSRPTRMPTFRPWSMLKRRSLHWWGRVDTSRAGRPARRSMRTSISSVTVPPI